MTDIFKINHNQKYWEKTNRIFILKKTNCCNIDSFHTASIIYSIVPTVLKEHVFTPDTNLDYPNKGEIEKKKAVIQMSKIIRIVRLAVKISSTQNGLDSAIYLLTLIAINVQIDVSRSIVLYCQ